jgi:hypothetical protein
MRVDVRVIRFTAKVTSVSMPGRARSRAVEDATIVPVGVAPSVVLRVLISSAEGEGPFRAGERVSFFVPDVRAIVGDAPEQACGREFDFVVDAEEDGERLRYWAMRATPRALSSYFQSPVAPRNWEPMPPLVFEGSIVAVEMLGARTIQCIPMGFDCRFAVTVRVTSVASDDAWLRVGEERTFAIHSPARDLMMDWEEPPLGELYAFEAQRMRAKNTAAETVVSYTGLQGRPARVKDA